MCPEFLSKPRAQIVIASDPARLTLPLSSEPSNNPVYKKLSGPFSCCLHERDKTRCASFISLSRRSPHTNTSHSAAAHCSRKKSTPLRLILKSEYLFGPRRAGIRIFLPATFPIAIPQDQCLMFYIYDHFAVWRKL